MSKAAASNPGAAGYGANAGEPGATGRRCYTGTEFLSTAPGILNIVILIVILCVLISAGIAKSENGANADTLSFATQAKISAVATGNAVIALGVIGLILLLLDTILHATGLINRFSLKMDLYFIIIMFVIAGIYFVLACCAAAWEQKLSDTIGLERTYKHPGAAAAASFFLFVAVILIITDFVLRIVRPAPAPPI